MVSAKELLNEVSYFRCEIDGVETIFPGILQEESKNIILNAKFPLEQYRKIEAEIEIDILGKVSGRKVTLIGCYIIPSLCAIEDNDISIHAVPNEIIVGGCFPLSPMVKRILVSTSDLNYMFSGTSPLKANFGLSEDNPSVLNYTFPNPIVANDKYGKIQIYQNLRFQRTVDFYKYNIMSLVEYSFTNSLPLMDAVAKVSAARILFSFFGNGYVPFGDITFEMDDNENTYGLWLNYKENVPSVKEPFFIGTSTFGNQFQNVWNAWLILYERANPIFDLFYEIICNHATRVNGFLNLSQAIELYSSIFRNDEAKHYAKNDPCNESKGKGIKLKHRYQDILTKYNDSLELIGSNIEDYAKGFSNMRNYYTHYNSGKYVEPTYDELYSASHILRFVLLTIIYTAVGIPQDRILECKKRRIFSRFGEDMQAILEYSKKRK